ncbi:hypothetical protein [Leptothoe kymatousa]|uniref:Uncharacterized protein n=1 Tax=Leptothoe kymatousa TAU-MAC 1615 TaxID=2364775 RepID=A0ABS5Y2R7_9CYAN|nr:hypothetical protein [Leptothoe kymatousa]MBT9311911.1 hypothetical protein [Leptothoe kymatousa TAU-MAC 1615]
MTNSATQFIPVSKLSAGTRRWQQTISGVTAVTLGFQGTVANATDVPLASVPADSATDIFVDRGFIEPVPAVVVPEGAASVQQPRFSPLGTVPEETIPVEAPPPDDSIRLFPIRHTGGSQILERARFKAPNGGGLGAWMSSSFLLKNDLQLRSNQPQPAVSLSVELLKHHRRELHRRSNAVESQLLNVQQLLSMPSYGNSFADRLLTEDEFYQSKLRKLQTLEAEIHTAIEQQDKILLEQLQHRLQRMDEDLRTLAQTRLQQHIEQAQGTSVSGLWQEPMYHSSLQWLMDHTHERHALKARQQTLAQTIVAMAVD